MLNILKSLIWITTLALSILFLFILFFFDGHYEANKALHALQKGDYEKTREIVENLKQEKLPLRNLIQKKIRQKELQDQIDLAKQELLHKDPSLIRQQLEELEGQVGGIEKEQLQFVRALTYFKDAEKAPAEVAASFIKLGFYNLWRSPLPQPVLFQEKAALLNLIYPFVAECKNEDLFFYAKALEYLQVDRNALPSDLLKGLCLKQSMREKEALEVLLHCEEQSPLLYFALGDTYYSLGQPLEARLALLRSQEIKNALPLLAAVERELGLTVEALDHLSQFFAFHPHATEGRSTLAGLLMEVGKYDQALTELQFLERQHLLTEQDQIAYVRCCLATDQTPLAKEKALAWNAFLSPLKQIELARLWILLGDPSYARQLDKETHSVQMLTLFREMGDFDTALEMSQKLPATSEGFLALAQLQADLGRPKKAERLARKALDLDPKNLEALAFLESYDMSLLASQERLKKILKQQELFPESPSLLLQEAHALIDLAMAQHRRLPHVSFSNNMPLRKAQFILEKGMGALSLPRRFFLLGEIAFLCDRWKDALQYFQRAISLNGSDVEAYKYLGIISSKMRQPEKAQEAFTKALHYAPNNVEAWKKLADLQLAEGKYEGAAASFSQVVKYRPRHKEACYQLSFCQLCLQLGFP